jgi:hypothetical protein
MVKVSLPTILFVKNFFPVRAISMVPCRFDVAQRLLGAEPSKRRAGAGK